MTRFLEPNDDAFERADAEMAYADELGRVVREAWVAYCKETGDKKMSHLAPWEELDEWNQEADRRVGMAVAAWIRQREREAHEAAAEAQDYAEWASERGGRR